MDHSYEELRNAALEVLSGRVRTFYPPNQYRHLQNSISDVLQSRGRSDPIYNTKLSAADSDLFLELFWDL